MNDQFQIDTRALEEAIARDRSAGLSPFLISATAGTVDVGAIDNLAAIAAIAEREKVWFHVDGAFGALAMLAPDLAPRLAGSNGPIPSLLISTSGDRCPTMQGLSSSGTVLASGHVRSPAAYLRRETAGWRVARRGPATLGQICRVVFER